MRIIKGAVRWAALPLLQLFLVGTSSAQEYCNVSNPDSTISQVPVDYVIVIQPVYISTYVPQNTEFIIGTGLTITVTNAPATIDTTVLVTVTSVQVVGSDS
jgi:hypothetical protein